MAKKYIVDLNKDEKAELVALTQQETVSTERRTLIDKTRLTRLSKNVHLDAQVIPKHKISTLYGVMIQFTILSTAWYIHLPRWAFN